MNNYDVLIVGGGVIGLSVAWELAGQGVRSIVVDQGQPGAETSWAGAGMLPAQAKRENAHPIEALTVLSNELHPVWAEKLRELTGIDNGYRRSGGMYVARSDADAAVLNAVGAEWRQDGLAAENVDAESQQRVIPALAGGLKSCWYVPEDAQVRNPRHLQALQAACVRGGVRIEAGAAVEQFDLAGERIVRVQTAGGSFSPGQVCLCTGAWTGRVAEQLGRRLRVCPVRGQIALLRLPAPAFTQSVSERHRYLVPRDDGRVLVGSTEEDVGFDKRTTAAGIADLLDFACQTVPALRHAALEKTWAGLRPATEDGMPYLGRMGGIANLVVAAGHYRAGLQLSTGTARVIGQLLRAERPETDLGPFSPNR